MQGATARVYDYYYARPQRQEEPPVVAVPSPIKKKQTASSPVTHPGFAIVVKSTLMFFALALVLVFLCVQAAMLNYQIIALEQENQQLETESLRLEYLISERQSLQYIEGIATTELNMIKPEVGADYVVALKEIPETVTLSNMEASMPLEATEAKGEGVLAQIYQSITRLAGRGDDKI